MRPQLLLPQDIVFYLKGTLSVEVDLVQEIEQGFKGDAIHHSVICVKVVEICFKDHILQK